MAARYTDGFDHYTTVLENWTTVSPTGTVSISSGNGRRGSASLRLVCANTAVWVAKVFDAQATWTVGFSVKLSAFSSSPILLSLMDDAIEHVRLHVTTGGLLVVSRAGNLLGTSSSGITLNTLAYIEIKATIADASAPFEVRVNGASVLSGSGDTRNAGNATANSIRFGQSGAAQTYTMDIDDLYVLDGQGSAPLNTFLGDGKPVVIYPSATGNAHVWTPSTGAAADSWQLLDENPPNGDSDYISSATVGDKTLTEFGDLPSGSGTVHFVQVASYARKDDAGARTIIHVTRSDGVDYDSAAFSLGDSYALQNSLRETDPDTGVAWTAAGVNAAQFGVKVAS